MLAESREQLIAEIDRRLEDKLIEQKNADLLKRLIKNAETLSDAIDIAELGTTWKRTGFHFDKRLEGQKGNTIKYFKKNEDLSFSDGKGGVIHKLIIGDNYDALLNLLIEYRGRIDVIYIDPPYGKDSMGQFADTNYNNAITRDNLLSMLYPRLILAKQLLSVDGAIFVSIDDKNQAYVKCLMDEIFRENNFIACAPRKTGAGDAATRGDSELRKPYDYVLIYSNSRVEVSLNKKIVGEKQYPLSDKLGSYYLAQFQASGSDSTRKARPKLYYSIFLQEDGSLSLNRNLMTIKELLPSKVNGEDGRWMWSKEKFETSAKNELVYDGDKLKRKVYYDESKDQNKYQVEKAFFDDSSFRNAEGTNLLNSIIGKGLFKNPKPVGLIKHLINLISNEDSIILDFFAGSGTTGQAVLELNKEDDGKRQFILCTLNEITDINPNGVAYDVTSKRLKRVMAGICYDETSDFEWIKKNEPYGGTLDVYEIESVSNAENTKGKTAFDVIDETLYGKEKFKTLKDKIDWVCSNFDGTQRIIESDEDWVKRLGV
ncbi:site-specific DNA-methyltransferase [bacterium]|nr:site-specific DNA-methyltransferase [bacterium]